jgi:hypothetical protein
VSDVSGQEPQGDPTTSVPEDPTTTAVPDESTNTTTAPDESTSTTTVPGVRTIDDRGITVVVPSGWEAEIYRRSPQRIDYGDDVPVSRRFQESTRSIVHIANFPLPEKRGDYGSRAVEIMGDQDVLVILFEFEPGSAGEPMFAADGLPRPVRAADFDPNQMQRPLPGMAGMQRFFNVDGERAFCVFAVIGSFAARRELAPVVDEVLAGITIEP